MDIKHVTIVDDDIDVFNPMDVEWAVATRVQADRDVVTLANARAKPLDPSLPVQRHGTVPTTAKMGIDATIPEGVPRERFERIRSEEHTSELQSLMRISYAVFCLKKKKKKKKNTQ